MKSSAFRRVMVLLVLVLGLALFFYTRRTSAPLGTAQETVREAVEAPAASSAPSAQAAAPEAIAQSISQGATESPVRAKAEDFAGRNFTAQDQEMLKKCRIEGAPKDQAELAVILAGKAGGETRRVPLWEAIRFEAKGKEFRLRRDGSSESWFRVEADGLPSRVEDAREVEGLRAQVPEAQVLGRWARTAWGNDLQVESRDGQVTEVLWTGSPALGALHCDVRCLCQ